MVNDQFSPYSLHSVQFRLCTMKITYLVCKCQMSWQFDQTVKILPSPSTVLAYMAQTGLRGKASVKHTQTKVSLKLKSVKHHKKPFLRGFLF